MPEHPRDITATDLDLMLRGSAYPAELRSLVARARATIGFFPAHNPRALEYPWILANLPSDLRGLRILDVGAGVNPLPFVLADRGALVTTIDNHPLIRAASDRSEWNEWGFLDYAALDGRIASVHRAYEDYDTALPFDCVFSVSVIEHLPAAVRHIWIAKFRRHLQPGGVLLLTVDLVPGSESLWNLAEGRVVESAELHGTFARLLAELESAAFEITGTDVQREIRGSLVDTGFVKAV